MQGHLPGGIKCEVCGARAVGYHYGVDVCTGCRVGELQQIVTIISNICVDFKEYVENLQIVT